MTPAGIWTPENIERLKSLDAQGYSTSLIAERFGVTRNAVIGKMHRLGMSKPCAARRKPTVTRARPKPEKKPMFKLPQPVPVRPGPPGGLDLLDLKADHCRYPINDAPPYRFCAASVAFAGCPWCVSHHAIVYTPVRDRRSA
jgi:GcrA cell cycle regulator